MTGRPLDDLRKQAEDDPSIELGSEAPDENPLAVTYVDHENMGSLYESLKEKEVKIRMISRFAWVTCKNNLYIITSFDGIKVKLMKESDSSEDAALFGLV